MLEKARPDELESIQHQIAFGHLGQAHINRWTANAEKAKKKNKKAAGQSVVKMELGGDDTMRDDIKDEM